MTTRSLLACGIVAMLWYVIINIIVPLQNPNYDIASQTISELSAIDAPTRQLWFVLCIFYSILFIAFGIGVWLSAYGNRKQMIVAGVIIFDAIFGIFWPPMHQREVLVAGGGTISDTLHIVWTFVHLVMILLMIGFGAALFGKAFRVFSVSIVFVFIVFGLLTSNESGGLETGLPTPYIGIWERINIAAYMFWIVVFTMGLIRRENPEVSSKAQLI
jgi:hypothetical protein